MSVDAIGVVGSGEPLLPSADPFHRPPRGFAARPPGTILRSRRVDLAAFGLVPQRASAWQLLYRSTDMHGAPEVAITTVLLPDGAEPGEDRPLLAFQTAMDAVTERCSPSYALRRGSRALGSVTQMEWLLVANALRRGWAVSLADHEGPHGNFGAPREPGYRALDGLRAALSFEPLGLPADTRIGVWGYSGGGMASSWAVEMAPTYAPELNIVGAVLGAPVGDPGQVFERLNGGHYAGLPAIVIAALHRLYPALGEVVARDMTDDGRRFLGIAERSTPLAAILALAGKRVDDLISRPLDEVLASPEFRAMFDDLRLGNSIPACPLLVVQPVHDQVIHMDGVDGQVARYRRGGAHVTYVRDRLSEHFSMMVLGTPMSLDWLADRLAGEPPTADGDTTVWSVLTSPTTLRGLLEIATTTARVLLGRPLRSDPAPAPAAVTERAA
ncbi:lipase [Nocardia puris]|uniref:Triacylglycerol lipase n=1 Tax=Nocardia puris TaxID=208602 RepID=A0A366DMZ0_9NOCA|nr:lipase family protein [Nocardia puris]MBF6213464.1 lipase [Nocardia puris]MBF6365606.1 lipase [Nocardia puris]MBF6460072.1 lipase [Nocardia puris]RBO91442.1 triacylglycerol lipase [Nocardia puris]